MKITATASGTSSASGITVAAKVFTGAIEAGGGAATADTSTTPTTASVTPAQSSSTVVYVGSNDSALTAVTPATNCTAYDADINGTNYEWATGHFTGTVTAGTPVAAGLVHTAGNQIGVAAYEIQGTASLDGSTPAQATATGAKTVTTAGFTPPAGSVITALVVTNGTGSAGTIALALSDDTGLVWTPRASELIDNGTGSPGGSVWIFTATVPTPQPYEYVGAAPATGSGSRSATVSKATNAGDTLCVTISVNNTGAIAPISAVTDSQGNVYTLDQSFSTTSPSIYLYRSPGATGGSTGGPTKALSTSDTFSFTVGSTSANTPWIGICAPGVGALDQVSAIQNTGGSLAVTGTVALTPAVDNETAVSGIMVGSGSSAILYQSPFSDAGFQQPASALATDMGWLRLGAGTGGVSLTATCNWTTSVIWRMGMWLFKPLVAPPPTPAYRGGKFYQRKKRVRQQKVFGPGVTLVIIDSTGMTATGASTFDDTPGVVQGVTASFSGLGTFTNNTVTEIVTSTTATAASTFANAHVTQGSSGTFTSASTFVNNTITQGVTAALTALSTLTNSSVVQIVNNTAATALSTFVNNSVVQIVTGMTFTGLSTFLNIVTLFGTATFNAVSTFTNNSVTQGVIASLTGASTFVNGSVVQPVLGTVLTAASTFTNSSVVQKIITGSITGLSTFTNSSIVQGVKATLTSASTFVNSSITQGVTAVLTAGSTCTSFVTQGCKATLTAASTFANSSIVQKIITGAMTGLSTFVGIGTASNSRFNFCDLQLGGSVTGNAFGGVATNLQYGGTATGNRYGGTASNLLYGGTATIKNLYGGTALSNNHYGGTVTETNLYGGTVTCPSN